MILAKLLAITPNAEKTIEQAGRTCYQSASKIEPGSEKELILKIINLGHHSVLEHASATFRITGVSRSFTHQLVRHRLCAFSQQSQRYVNEKKFGFVEPESIAGDPKAHDLFEQFIADAKTAYCKLQQLGVRNEDARFVLPNAVESEIVMSANFRQFRHMFCLRCGKHAQWEIRKAFLYMLMILQREAPSVFGDFIIDEDSCTASTPFPS
jgi:thymidylate synthase (FAD)